MCNHRVSNKDSLAAVFLFLQRPKPIAVVARIVATIGRVMVKCLPVLLPDGPVAGRRVNLDFSSYDCNLFLLNYILTTWSFTDCRVCKFWQLNHRVAEKEFSVVKYEVAADLYHLGTHLAAERCGLHLNQI